MSAAAEVLRRALGAAAVSEHPALELDGAKLEVTALPADGAALAEALRALGGAGLAAIPRGGGTRLALGNPPRRADCLLSCERLDRIDVLDGDEGVAHVGAGTRLAALRERAAPLGWEPPLDPPGARTTVGGALAAAAVGPRLAGFGPPRDAALGLEVVLASGERTKSGGRVVKNVTGYDLPRLYTGSLGTLGVIEAAWLRLRPLPERSVVLCAPLAEGPAAFDQARAAARRPAVRAAALLDAGLAGRAGAGAAAPGRPLLVVELAGAAAAVRETQAALAQEAGLAETAPETLERVRALQQELAPEGGLQLRLAVLPSRLAAAAAALAEAGAALLAYPGPGLLYAGFGLGDELAADAALRAARAAAGAAGGGWRIEAAPAWAKTGRDVFGEPAAALPLLRAVKERFDPGGVLSPGRFAGWI